jgi:hypothetical protein
MYGMVVLLSDGKCVALRQRWRKAETVSEIIVLAHFFCLRERKRGCNGREVCLPTTGNASVKVQWPAGMK